MQLHLLNVKERVSRLRQTLLLELNLIVQAWKPYASLELKAPGLKKVLGWGTKKYDQK